MNSQISGSWNPRNVFEEHRKRLGWDWKSNELSRPFCPQLRRISARLLQVGLKIENLLSHILL